MTQTFAKVGCSQADGDSDWMADRPVPNLSDRATLRNALGTLIAVIKPRSSQPDEQMMHFMGNLEMAGSMLKRQLLRSLSKPIVLIILCFSVVNLVIACAPSPPSAESAESPSATYTPAAVPSASLALGTNLSSIVDWSTQLAFVDAMKSSRHWLTQCDADEPGCTGGWDTPERDLLDLDERGWVKSLPDPEDPPEYTKVGTLLRREIQGQYQGGQYVVLYEGTGTIEYRYDAEKDEAASRPGRDVINVTPSQSGIYLLIAETDPDGTGDYIRDIHVVPAEYEETFTTQPFYSLFLDRLQPFSALRFMDWMATNNSTVSEWSDRPQVDDARYSDKGVPLELMAQLVNELDVDAWLCMPHLATDDYIRRFAQQAKELIEPDRHIYVEYSNEVWNWQFSQATYALEQGQERWNQDGDVFMQWYGMRAAQMADIWRAVFGDESDRLTLVTSSQTGWRGLEPAALDCPLWVEEGNTPCYQHMDAYAMTGYFSGKLSDPENEAAIEAWLDDPEQATENALMQLHGENLLPNNGDSILTSRDSFAYFGQVAQDHGLEFLVYEGGQHIVSSNNETLTDFYIELNRHPGMYDLYTNLLKTWEDAGGDLFMNFSSIARPGRWGCWGVLETVYDDSSPKYDALVDFAETLEQ
jgi:hypothetical protein